MSAEWDNDYLWREVQGAKLAFLFGLDQAVCQGDESFQFTAPKQPKKICSKSDPRAVKTTTTSVLFAAAVHAFVLVHGQYVKQGRIGVAVLGNHDTKEYKILLYGCNQKQITTARIHRGFVLTVQSANYITFYNDQKQNWSLMFEEEKIRVEFCKEVCICKWNSESLADSLVTQELVLGEGQAVTFGDTVELTINKWFMENQSPTPIFESTQGKERQKVKLGTGQAIRGWEDGMVGLQKGGRRLFIVPPSLSSASKDVLNNTPLMFDVEIQRVKFSREGRKGGRASPGLKRETLTSQKKDSDGKIESLSKCLLNVNEASSHPSLLKPDDMSCSLRPPSSENTVPSLSEANRAHMFPPHFFSQFPNDPSQITALKHSLDKTSFCTFDTHQLSEILVALENMAQKVDKLTCKVDEVQKENSLLFKCTSVSSETNMILHNIQKILQEKMCLKTEMVENILQSQAGLLQVDQDQAPSNARPCGSHDDMVNVQKRATKLNSEDKHKLGASVLLNNNHVEGCLKMTEQPDQKERETQEDEKKTRDVEMQDPKAADKDLDQANSNGQTKSQSSVENQQNEPEVPQMQQQVVKETPGTDQHQLDKQLKLQVKRVMNGVFHSLKDQFDTQESYTGQTVIQILLHTIKNVTIHHLTEPWQLE